jgi:drug/metabolite transporter (DMT)-like permease
MPNMIETNKRHRALLFLVGTAVLWSIGGFLIKSINWPPLAIAGMRSIIAAFVIRWFFRDSRLTWSPAQLTAAVAYAATVILFVTATKMTTAANAILLQFTAPIYVALLGGWLLNEKTNRGDWLAIVAVFGGMSLFFVEHVTVGSLLGNLCAIASGVTFALFTIYMRKQKDASPFGSVLIGNVLTFIIGLPFMFTTSPDVQGWGALLVLGFFQLGLSYVLYTYAIKEVTALEAIMIPVIEPLLNPFWVFLLLGETPSRWALIGGIIIVFAVSARYVVGVATKESALTNKKIAEREICPEINRIE